MNKTSRYIVLLMLLVFILLPASTFAGTGDGTGDGDSKGLGENKDIPLTLEKSSIKNNSDDITLNETIQLDFTKNICNITVISNNKMCFHLTDELGTPVPVILIFPDDQVQKDYKRQVFIDPISDLEAESTYYIVVDDTLAAKNGTYIDRGYVIKFTTGTGYTNRENKILSDLGDFVITYEMTDSVPLNVSDLENIAQDSGYDFGITAKITAICLIVVLVIFTAFFIVIKRRKE